MIAQEKYVPAGDMHLTFLVTPVQEDLLGQGLQQQGKSNARSMQWKTFYDLYRKMLSDSKSRKHLEVARTCGISDKFLARSF